VFAAPHDLLQPLPLLIRKPPGPDRSAIARSCTRLRDLATSGMTMIVVTHEMAFAREADDALVFMDDGVVVEAGRPRDVLSNPQHERTRTFPSKVR
jgi:polar amino acid transport system ATP-binding protein